MKHRIQRSMRIAAVATAALLTASCGDSGETIPDGYEKLNELLAPA